MNTQFCTIRYGQPFGLLTEEVVGLCAFLSSESAQSLALLQNLEITLLAEGIPDRSSYP